MNPAAIVAIGTVLLTQIGLIASVWLQRRKTKLEADATSVDILKDVNGELRIEMQRISDTRKSDIEEAHRERDEARMDAAELRDELRLSRQETRGAHETTGRAMRRVEYLEGVLRDQGISYPPGPLS